MGLMSLAEMTLMCKSIQERKKGSKKEGHTRNTTIKKKSFCNYLQILIFQDVFLPLGGTLATLFLFVKSLGIIKKIYAVLIFLLLRDFFRDIISRIQLSFTGVGGGGGTAHWP